MFNRVPEQNQLELHSGNDSERLRPGNVDLVLLERLGKGVVSIFGNQNVEEVRSVCWPGGCLE
jgi:hypothetical protein